MQTGLAARARNVELQAALIAVRDRCTYPKSREPRFVMTNARELIEIVDAALGEK